LTRFSTRWRGLVEAEEVSYRSWDGLYIQGFLFRPPGFAEGGDATASAGTATYPALVMVHGGGTNSYLKGLSLTEQHLAQLGYVVLAVNYRGGSGFGREFQDLGVGDWANGQALDAAAAADFLRAQPWSNGKVGIYGYSYGGIQSMAAIARAPDAFDAAVPMAGIYDFADAYTNADRLGKIFIRTGHGGAPGDRPEVYAISNTLARVPNVVTPTLIMHGEEDVRAPYRQYELAVEILDREGKVFESHSYPGEPHGFRDPMNRVDMYRRLEAWFDRWLKEDAPDAQSTAAGTGAPVWPGEEWAVSTPEAEGLDPTAIDSLIADIDAGRFGLIDHFLLIRRGHVIANRHWDHGEEYARILAEQEDTASHPYNYDHPDWHPYYRDTGLHTLQSVTKSVTSVAFGIAVDAGHIDGVDAPAWPFLAAYGPDLGEPARANATLEDFLTMRSGIDWAIPGQTYADDTHPTSELEASEAWIDYVVRRPVGTEPGTRFDYNDGVSVLLGKILREATGQRADAWAEEHLFRPIGIRDYYWKITPDGEADTEGGLYLAPHDLARIAYLMLRGGEWDGRRIVSRAWVRASTSPVIPDLNPGNDRDDGGYGYQWWVPFHEDGETRVFSGNGYGGQFLHVVPEHDLIVLFNGWTLHTGAEFSSWTALQDRILPAIRD
ncbi:MAG: alpha/beta fold hydrolase, partial [Gammaproteobacteria bacterium]|nr:alpha/beta fold hydrolase [Gammaproteobacteria bacterium]